MGYINSRNGQKLRWFIITSPCSVLFPHFSIFAFLYSRPISVLAKLKSLGPETLGRIINVVGDPIDERGPVPTDKRQAIHAEAPEFSEMSVEQEILVTGIKVVDLLAPYAKGGKIGEILVLFIILTVRFTSYKFKNLLSCLRIAKMKIYFFSSRQNQAKATNLIVMRKPV